MNNADYQYLQLVRQILSEGSLKQSRAGETIGIFGHQMRFDLREGFPLLTTKKINFDYVYYELMAFLRGETNIKGFEKCKKLWEDFAEKGTGDLNYLYGKQWVDWNYDSGSYRHNSGKGFNQIQKLIDTLKTNPNDRRMIVTAWNPPEIDLMALPPCHMMFQCYHDDGYLDLQMYQRSCDTAIGVPFNIASYALLLTMLAKEVRMTPRYFIHTLGDAHIYTQHIPAISKQLEREGATDLPTIELCSQSFWEFPKNDSVDDVGLYNYTPEPHIKFALNV